MEFCDFLCIYASIPKERGLCTAKSCRTVSGIRCRLFKRIVAKGSPCNKKRRAKMGSQFNGKTLGLHPNDKGSTPLGSTKLTKEDTHDREYLVPLAGTQEAVMSYYPRRNRDAKDYGEMGSNPNRKRRGKKRGMKGGKQKKARRA